MKRLKYILFLFGITILATNTSILYAAAPSGDDTFQLLASPSTGSDNTGDGGTGLAADLNYFYVGQSFSTFIEIVSGGTTSSNIWVDYLSDMITANNLSNGTFFNTWSGQNIEPTATGANGGRVSSTGSQIPSSTRSGTGSFGSIDWIMLQPTGANYSSASPITLDINIGAVGETTESNIAMNGVDVLDDAEDFRFHIWADTIPPFAENPSPASAAVGVSTSSNYRFDLRDTLNGEGDNTGVGTGVNTSTPPGAITFNDGTGAIDYTSYDSYSCSGTWGTNFCSVTINPTSPLGISSDARNWKYGTTYTVDIHNFKDLASSNQDQLGDVNGPNTMSPKSYTFTTESDVIAPKVISESPTRGSSNISVNTNIDLRIEDRKTYPTGISGTGINPSSCNITISSPSSPATIYTQGDANLTVQAVDYGYTFSIDPPSDFAQNEIVSVKVDDCIDLAGNTMATDQYSFVTTDSSAPYVDEISPDNDTNINTDGAVSFHIKDSGVGIDLASTVIYVNGEYYTNGGGAGSVTVSGTRITFADSLDFNGGNYAGDLTSLTGSSVDYTFVIDPEVDFQAGESIPVAIYTRDSSGNNMERVLYGLSTSGSICATGDSFCGSNTSWNGAQCIGTVSTSSITQSCPSYSGGGGMILLEISDSRIATTQINETSVLITWFSTIRGSSRVLYDTMPTKPTSLAPNYGLAISTEESQDNSVYHSVIVNNLNPGRLYYFRPVTKANGNEVVGPEIKMSPIFKHTVIETFVQGEEKMTCPALPEISEPIIEQNENIRHVYTVPSIITPTIEELKDTTQVETKVLKVTNMDIVNKGIGISGKGTPNSLIKIEIY